MKRLLLVLLITVPHFAFSQYSFDGNITETGWSVPLGTSTGGAAPCFGAGHEINSLYATGFSNHIGFGIGGNVQNNNRILLFIDSKTGGFNNGNFGRTGAPAGINNFNSGTTFDNNFLPDYCLIIGTDATRSDFYFDLYELGGTASGGGGSNKYLGSANASATDSIGVNAINGDATKGFEIAIRKTDLGYNTAGQSSLQLMAMYISDGGFLANQFISYANAGEGCYTNNAIAFQTAAPNPVNFDPTQILPIDFIKLSTRVFNDYIKLFWSAASERNMLQYEIEKSGNGINFQTMATLPAVGNSPTEVPYSWSDLQPIVGVNYYRIKAIDRDGKRAYSQFLRVYYGRVDNSLAIYPNPVQGHRLNLLITNIKKGTYALRIFNDMGQEVLSQEIEHNGVVGIRNVDLPLSLKKGPYRLLLIDDTKFYKQTFIIQ
jgi:hypothetical protein